MKIIINEPTYKKVMHWVHKTSNEVSGFGVTTIDDTPDGKVITVHDAFLLEQEVGAAHTDIDATALGKLMYRVHKDPAYRGMQLNWWWHSHVMMQVFWSGTDKETIMSTGKNGLCIASVFNQKAEIRSAICYKVENEIFGPSVQFIDDVKTQYMYTQDPRITEWDLEFTNSVKQRTFQPKHLLYDYDGPEQGNLLNTNVADEIARLDRKSEAAKIKRKDDNSIKLSKQDYDYGLIGLGVDCEAKALGIHRNKLAAALKNADTNKLMIYEYDLQKLIEEGKLQWPSYQGGY